MKIILYSGASEELSNGIEDRLGKILPKETVETYRSIDKLALRLKRLFDYDTIVVLIARNREELLRIVSLCDLLQGLRVILLLPDRKKETISLAHRLRPRFLGNSEGDSSDTLSVLQKMLGYGE